MPGNVLLLQGPMGPFFRRLAADLAGEGTRVYKINFNGGDWLYYRGAGATRFSGRLEQWPAFLEARIREWEIDTLYLFGDTRVYHALAREVADRLNVQTGVFEEGYLRPHYITLEAGGVNGRSSLSRDPDFFRRAGAPDEPQPRAILNGFRNAGWYAACYYLAGWLGRGLFPHYRHHRPFRFYDEAYLWCRSGFRKFKYRQQQRRLLAALTGRYAGKYFLVPLQVHCDGQIRTCEHIASAASFVRRVVGSFARHAPADTRLVLKHHPLDRGYSDYSALIRKLASRYGVEDRVDYVHDLHLPTLLRHALGTVVINSTVGLSALLHGTPVKTLGHAVYDLPGLTFQGSLDQFWTDPGRVDRTLNRQFRNYLAATSQLNGSFYSRTAGVPTASGLDLRRLQGALNGEPDLRLLARQDRLMPVAVSWTPARPDRAFATAAAGHAPPASYDDGLPSAMAAHDGTDG
jgi:capsular polysaccharide export protein